jgi:branched-chain amino acid transport system ATP-binding protein
MLQLAAVDTYYDRSHVLHDVSLEVATGQVTCLLGRNGAGKTTIVSSIIGFVLASRGGIYFDGADITAWPIEKRAGAGISLVPQGRRVFPLLTTEENLLIGSKPKRGQWTLPRVYEFFPRLRERQRSLAGHLSGGEQQMLAIARALMANPSLILMDEPSEGLAPVVIDEVYRVIGEVAAQGMSILLVEHSLDLAISLARNLYIVGKGRIVWQSNDSSELTGAVREQYLGVG